MAANDIGSIQEQLAGPGGPLGKYRRTAVGDRGWGSLLLYEAVLFLAGSLPGDSGIRMRRVLYPLLFGKLGKQVTFSRDVSARRPHRIVVGDRVWIGERVALDVKSAGTGIRLGRGVRIGAATIFSCPGGEISIGDETVVGASCRLGSLQGLSVGRNCVIGDCSYLVGAGHTYHSLEQPIIEQPLTCRGPGVVGDHVRIGARVTILDGITVGSHVSIADDSLVTANIPDGCRVGGVPARELTGA